MRNSFLLAVHRAKGCITIYGQEFAPGVDTLTVNSPAPAQLGAGGIYPAPQPGRLKDQEY